MPKYLTPKQTEKKPLPKFPIPGWLFAAAFAVYCEVVMHLWISDEVSMGRLAAVALFAAGFGGVLGVIVSFFNRPKLAKIVTLALSFLVAVLLMVEYFISDSYQTFMPLISIFTSAGGVATDFMGPVIQIVSSNLWRIGLILLPLAAYLLFARPVETSWRTRWFLTVGALALYLAGFQVVQTVGVDADRMSSAYNFDSAVRVFGLNMALGLDTVRSGDDQAAGEFTIEMPEEPEIQIPQTEPADPTAETEPEPIVYGDNVLPLDFGQLKEEERTKRVASIHKYVDSLTPSKKNEYTGLFEGKNLILITAEAFSREVLDPELTPTLYRLANEGIQFKDYYQPMWGGSTSTGEFSILTGLVANSGTDSVNEAVQQDLFFTMGNQLQDLGYHSMAYHNHLYSFYGRNKTHPGFGYEKLIGMGNGMEEGVKDRWPESDLEMMNFTVPQYIDKQPFSIYYMTVSAHCGYRLESNAMSRKNFEAVDHLDASETVKAYLAANLELEYAMASLVKQLEDAGIADNTVIVLSTDHYPYGLEPSGAWENQKDYLVELYGYEAKNVSQRDHNALIIWSGCIEDMDIVVEEPVYSLDILPTLSNLFGLEFDSRLTVGRDVFSDAEPIVLWNDFSWKTDKGFFNAEKKKFTANEGVEVEEGYVDRISAIVKNKITYCREVATTNYFDYVSDALKAYRKAQTAESTEPVEETTQP